MMLRKNSLCTILSAFLGTFLILAVIIAYSQYLTLKKTLLERISEKTTGLIGQKVEIGDISLSAAAGITIRDIIIRNPEGFVQGDLLRINSVHLGIRYGELLQGRFSFRGIEVESPELTLITDANRHLNVSDALIRFLSQKGTATYQVDVLIINDARFAIHGDPFFTVRDINVTMNGLSSAPGTKTIVKASLEFLGKNRLTAEGWIFLKDLSRKFRVDLSSDMADPSLLAQKFAPYGMNIEKSRAHLTLHAEGDRDKGVRLSTEADLRSMGLSLLRKGGRDISLRADAFLDFKADACTIDRAVLRAGETATVQMKGSIRSLLQSPSYEAELKIDSLDLSALNIMKGLKAGGVVTSDLIHLKGSLSRTLPVAKGTVMISSGSWDMDKTGITSVNGKLVFSSDKEMSVRAEVSAHIHKAGGLVFGKPAAVHLALEGKGVPENIALSTKLNLSAVDIAVNNKPVIMEDAAISFDGSVKKATVSGTIALAAAGLSYEDFRLRNLSLRFGLDHGSRKTAMRGLKAASDLMHAAADAVVIAWPDSTEKYRIEAKNIRAAYPEQKAELSGLDCVLSLQSEGKALSGELSFLLQKAAVRDTPVEMISGRGSFDSRRFSIDIRSAKVLTGAVTLSAKGSMQNGPLPADIEMTAEHIDLGQASGAVRPRIAMPYHATGEIEHFTFRGAVASAESVTGTGSLKGRNLAVTNAENRSIIKDARISADAIFRGKDMDLRADTTIGNLASSLSGTISRFAENDRSLRLSITVPEVNVNDIRTSFWDMFPDPLLYAGLEGSIALQLSTTYGNNVTTAEGTVLLRDIMIEGENGEYAAGPLTGTLPVHYDSAAKEEKPASFPSFEQDNFDEIKKLYAEERQFTGNEIRIGSVRYGFRLLEDVSFRIVQKGTTLNINHFSAKMFGGRLNGAAFISLSPVLNYRAGLIVDAVSLTRMCEDITPIRGYISGKVNGIAALKGSGTGLAKITGKADFWTYSDRKEKTRISREFLEKIGGPQVKAYLGERRFTKGVMKSYIQNGFLIFRELEISNKNFLGVTDLSVKVAPLNNRIAIDHLMWTITEAAQRAKKQ